MPRRTKDALKLRFGRGVLFLGLLFSVLFGLEFWFEYVRLGKPSYTDMSWDGVNNAKILDSLSPIARAYNNVLAMLIATVGLAIPLTANMHTPKLIDLFLKDRINRIVLTAMALGAANVLWVSYMIGPNFAPMWAVRAAIYGALFGWVVLIPYYFYVIRFLDPSTMVVRLTQDAIGLVEKARDGKCDIERAQDEIQERLLQIGTLIIKSIDRADRSVAREGIWALKRVVDGYGTHKSHMKEAWFKVDRADFVGMSGQAIELINRKRTWMEMQVLYQLLLCYQHALTKAPDAVSSISNVLRVIAVLAAKRRDEHVVSLCIRYFNTFLREAINHRSQRAAFDTFYQYRQLAIDVDEYPKFVRRIGRFFSTYATVADEAGLEFVSHLAAYDLEYLMEEAYQKENKSAGQLLEVLLAMPNTHRAVLRGARIRTKLIAGGFFVECGLSDEQHAVAEALRRVPPEALQAASEHLAAIGKRQFWEITDRAVNIEWTTRKRRESIAAFVKAMDLPVSERGHATAETSSPD